MVRAMRVLHVDDDPAILRVVAAKLNANGYEVISCDDPTKALSIISDNDIRVVITDIDMPKIMGLDLLERIKRYDGGIQVLVMTGLVNLTTVLESMRLGAEYCLFKPIDDWKPLLNGLERTFQKLESWWQSLATLRAMSRAERKLAATETPA